MGPKSGLTAWDSSSDPTSRTRIDGSRRHPSTSTQRIGATCGSAHSSPSGRASWTWRHTATAIRLTLRSSSSFRIGAKEADMNRSEEAARGRAIGVVGSIARIGLGLLFLSPSLVGRFQWHEALLGLAGFPAMLLLGQWLRLRRTRELLRATGPVGFLANVAVFLALYLTPVYFPPLSFTSDATLIFYGASMLLAGL